ncbi:MAG: hypothetical protein ISR48_04700 [Alphaproteobacteria bacterium]|nr:hypothetical protein [Alphaproteobacteria bacterium]
MKRVVHAISFTLIGLAAFFALITGAYSQEYDFETLRWGMELEEVGERVPGLVKEDAFSASTSKAIHRHEASISYLFADNKLGEVMILFQLYGDEVNEEERRRLFQILLEEYTKKYGDPVETDNLEDDSNKSAGWRTERTEVNLMIMGLDSHFLTIWHSSIAMKEEMEKARNAHIAAGE